MSRIRANQITNKTADGATTATNGFNVTGVCTATSFSGTVPSSSLSGALPALDGSALTGISQVGGASGVDFNDNVKARFGTGNDLEIFHNNHSYIKDVGSGGLYLLGSQIWIADPNASNPSALFNPTSHSALYYSGSERIRTADNGIQVGTGVTVDIHGQATFTGIVTATSFSGSGANLTGITITSSTQSNTIAGTDAGRDLTSNSNSNSYFGAVAGEKNDTGDNNCGFGRYSAYSIRGGSKNTMLGSESGVSCESGDGNVCIGFQAGYDVTGSNNTLIGHMAAGKSTSSTTDLTSGSNNIFIGYDVKSSTTTVSNEIALGNENINHFRIPGIGVSFTSTTATLTGLDLSGLLKEDIKITSGKISDGSNSNIYVEDGMVHYFTIQETTTTNPNFKFNSSTNLNNAMSIGETISVTIIVKAASGGYLPGILIDGAGVAEQWWVGGSNPSDGGSSNVDIYTYNIIKTANASFHVIANQTKTS